MLPISVELYAEKGNVVHASSAVEPPIQKLLISNKVFWASLTKSYSSSVSKLAGAHPSPRSTMYNVKKNYT